MNPTQLTLEHVARVAEGWAEAPESETTRAVKAISMLGSPTLATLRVFARVAAGPVLEIGPYIGGSTVAIALGIRDAGPGHIFTLERGGHYKTHPQAAEPQYRR